MVAAGAAGSEAGSAALDADPDLEAYLQVIAGRAAQPHDPRRSLAAVHRTVRFSSSTACSFLTLDGL